MWEPSDAIAIGALAVAALSLGYTWWDRRGARSESYRAALYERQLAAVDDLVGLVFDAHLELRGGGPPSKESDERLEEAQDRMTEYAFRSAYLPREIVSAGTKWLREVAEAQQKEVDWLEAVAKAMETGDQPPKQGVLLAQRLDDVWLKFVHRVQTETGTRQLNTQVRELTGAAAAKRRREDRIARRHRIDLEIEIRSRGHTKAPSIQTVIDEVEAEEMGRTGG